ncbi:MAG: phytanoyl-CoA dioxygenase family protein [Saprospiraceae bacterium]|nr:phytanoyl-CoA dioxygenase family protein [Saprospiraceae bacterium]
MTSQIFFEAEGFCVVKNILNEVEIGHYIELYDELLETTKHRPDIRSDLSGQVTKVGTEKITQIMRPSLLNPNLLEMPLHQKALQWAKLLLGSDMALDFDMLINKAPHTQAPTPWHQDEAYWINMPDKRAVSCWVALDESTQENGAMWFIPQSHLHSLRQHQQQVEGGPLVCEASEAEAVCVALQSGSCSFHHGRTVHYSRGNSTNGNRRAFILNFRPAAMIEYERERGFDHLGNREARANK